MSNAYLSGRIAVIGGCGGIGRDVCERLRERGAEPVVFDLPRSIAAHPPKDEAHGIDVLDADSLKVSARNAGPFSGMVNLAGFMSEGESVVYMDHKRWAEVLAGNLDGAFNVAQAFAPCIEDGGAIVFIGSGLGAMARPGYGPYAVAKAGISALTRQMALELAPSLRVNCVAPSAVDTAFLRGGTGRSDEDQAVRFDPQAYGQAVPLGRIARPSDVAGPILFLLSLEAAYITGQTIHVNGGINMT